MKVAITALYTMESTTIVDLPAGKTWDDVTHYLVKYGKVFITFNDETEFEADTDEATTDNTDFKYPDRTLVRPVDADGYPDWSADTLAEMGG
jgi:hypothetical protein